MCAVAETAVRPIGGGFSHESEYDLALMVSDFLENGCSSGGGSSCGGAADSWWSSDSDSGHCDLHQLADKISLLKCSIDKNESGFLSFVHSLILSIRSADLCLIKSGPCNASCIMFSLVKLLRLSGYDAGVCESRWQGSSKVPGGDHKYIDVLNYNAKGSERLIIDVDFRSHFEIARAVDSYNRILSSLPVVYVGSSTRLRQYLQVMAEAAKSSLKQNSMPLPPWRSLAYLQAKWQSPYHRRFYPLEPTFSRTDMSDHMQCRGHLKRLHSTLQSEREEDRYLKTLSNSNSCRSERWRQLFRAF